jgi:hypothetical protein
LNYSSIAGSSISSNTLTLSLTNASTQNTQIYQVATTNPTTSYTVIQASHVSTGTTNNALALNPSGGNVGVGTTTPSALLNIMGTATASTANTTILLDNSLSGGVIAAGGAIGSLQFSNSQFSSAPIVAGEVRCVVDTAGANNNGALTFHTRSDFVTNTEKMRITRFGNVGIGTTAPGAKLHVATDAAINTTPLSFVNGSGYGIYANSGGINARGNTLDFASNDFNNGSIIARNVMTLRPEGNVGIGKTDPAAALEVRNPTSPAIFSCINQGGTQAISVYTGNAAISALWAGTNTVLYVAKDNANNRSVNAAGTFNASGADYAEYMTKDSDFSALKGDILGVLPSGKLTNQFDAAIHFLLKSTNPCMVGGDVWGTEATVGEKPKDLAESATEEEKAAHATALAAWEARLEAERQKVDRMAFAGQVPVNIQGATPGNYIIPLRNADGTIGIAAIAQADMSFSQYQSAVGRVISILADGRANVIVKAV